MNKFEKQLEKWNNGILRGAQAKLAKALNVSTATVALWATGQRHPSKGYVSKMAQLFKLDIYHVARLFTPSNSYPDVFQDRPALSLHDAEQSIYPYSPAAFTSTQDMVTLPLFTKKTFPSLATSRPHEYWNIPRIYSEGATFLFQLPLTKDPNCILFVCSCPQWRHDTIMLIRYKNTYQLARVYVKKQTISLTSIQGTPLSVSSCKPLGIVRRQITTIN